MKYVMDLFGRRRLVRSVLAAGAGQATFGSGSSRANAHSRRRIACLGRSVAFAARLGTGMFALAAAVGCATGQSAADRAIAEMRADLTRLEADHARMSERLQALEAGSAAQARPEVLNPSTPMPRDIEADRPARPSLPVVRVGESGGADARADIAFSAGSSASGQGSEPSASAIDAAERAASSKDSPQARRLFDGAVALTKAKAYDKALRALTTFLVRYPDHPNAAQAMYLRGECLYRKNDHLRASREFEGLLARFPFCDKASDALLKLGMCLQKMGRPQQADEIFAELRQRYPNSAAAHQLSRR